MARQNPYWLDTELQFARLISEAEGLGLFTRGARKALCAETELSERDIEHLLGRARTRFDRAKKEILAGASNKTQRKRKEKICP